LAEARGIDPYNACLVAKRHIVLRGCWYTCCSLLVHSWLALAETVSKRTEAMDEIGAVIFGFLAPIFFVTAGMDVAVAELSRCWPIALVLLIASYPSKILATYIGLRLLVPSKSFGIKAANLFAARLTMSSIIVFTGLKSGTLLAELAEVVLLTAIVATLLAGSTSM